MAVNAAPCDGKLKLIIWRERGGERVRERERRERERGVGGEGRRERVSYMTWLCHINSNNIKYYVR